MALNSLVPHRIKNAAAKIFVTCWIAYLIFLAGQIISFALVFDANTWFALSGTRALPDELTIELRVVFVMLAASLMGGIVFMIRDFYQSIKYSNIYDRAYDDYKARMMGISEFQRIVTLQVYLGRFNYTWTFWFLLQPILSAVLGVVAYGIARSGLASILGGSTTEELSVRSLYLYMVFSFLAGFASHKFTAWLDRLAESVFKAPATQLYQETKRAVETSTINDRTDLRNEISETASDSASTNIDQIGDAEINKNLNTKSVTLQTTTMTTETLPVTPSPMPETSPPVVTESTIGMKSVR